MGEIISVEFGKRTEWSGFVDRLIELSEKPKKSVNSSRLAEMNRCYNEVVNHLTGVEECYSEESGLKHEVNVECSLCENSVGRGRIRFCAFDVAATSWDMFDMISELSIETLPDSGEDIVITIAFENLLV